MNERFKTQVVGFHLEGIEILSNSIPNPRARNRLCFPPVTKQQEQPNTKYTSIVLGIVMMVWNFERNLNSQN